MTSMNDVNDLAFQVLSQTSCINGHHFLNSETALAFTRCIIIPVFYCKC